MMVVQLVEVVLALEELVQVLHNLLEVTMYKFRIMFH
jgi:hypothetical protein